MNKDLKILANALNSLGFVSQARVVKGLIKTAKAYEIPTWKAGGFWARIARDGSLETLTGVSEANGGETGYVYRKLSVPNKNSAQVGTTETNKYSTVGEPGSLVKTKWFPFGNKIPGTKASPAPFLKGWMLTGQRDKAAYKKEVDTSGTETGSGSTTETPFFPNGKYPTKDEQKVPIIAVQKRLTELKAWYKDGEKKVPFKDDDGLWGNKSKSAWMSIMREALDTKTVSAEKALEMLNAKAGSIPRERKAEEGERLLKKYLMYNTGQDGARELPARDLIYKDHNGGKKFLTGDVADRWLAVGSIVSNLNTAYDTDNKDGMIEMTLVDVDVTKSPESGSQGQVAGQGQATGSFTGYNPRSITWKTGEKAGAIGASYDSSTRNYVFTFKFKNIKFTEGRAKGMLPIAKAAEGAELWIPISYRKSRELNGVLPDGSGDRSKITLKERNELAKKMKGSSSYTERQEMRGEAKRSNRYRRRGRR